MAVVAAGAGAGLAWWSMVRCCNACFGAWCGTRFEQTAKCEEGTLVNNAVAEVREVREQTSAFYTTTTTVFCVTMHARNCIVLADTIAGIARVSHACSVLRDQLRYFLARLNKNSLTYNNALLPLLFSYFLFRLRLDVCSANQRPTIKITALHVRRSCHSPNKTASKTNQHQK
jgi:hypothetical protein